MSDLISNPPFPNVPLLRKAVEWAEAEAAKTDGTCLWEQLDYVTEKPCGTAYCIAGWAVINTTPLARDSNGNYAKNGDPLYWHSEGSDVLGLTDTEAEDLFDERNGIEDIRRIAERIAARAGDRL